MIPRLLVKNIVSALEAHNKAIIVLGARQVGKTALLLKLQKQFTQQDKKVLYINCDTEEDLAVINTSSKTKLGALVQGIDYLFIDEAQRIDNPGLTIKVLHDLFPAVRLVVTGSSSFELKNSLSDALTGRYLDFTLSPLSIQEIILDAKDLAKPQRQVQADFLLESLLLHGSYPEIYQAKKPDEKKKFLEKIIESYLFKDILSFQKVRQPQVIKDLSRALAYQIGSEANENELAKRLKIDRKTVVSYLDILEQSFVITRLFPYSKNPQREIGKNVKVYFNDLGIRNALIGDFNPLNLRTDQGALWENFIIIERGKYWANQGLAVESHFWRSYTGAEVDYLERPLDQKQLQAYEIKLGENSLSKGSRGFERDYSVKLKLINKDNYLDYVAPL